MGWKPGADEFVPDAMVVPPPSETTRSTGTPALVVEVPSTNPYDDLVPTVGGYARAGPERCWIVDPRDGVLDGSVLEDGLHRPAVHPAAEDPPTELDVAGVPLGVDLATLLRP